jgi:uncharacterized protein
MYNIAFPYRYDSGGRTVGAGTDDHIRDLIAQVLFTSPGERVNRPDFGSGLMQAVFSPNSTEMLATTQYLVQGALQQNLAALIEVSKVDVSADDSTLTVTVAYVVRQTQQQQVAEFTRGRQSQ